MKKGHVAAIMLAGALALPVSIIAAAQNAPAAPNSAPAPARPGLTILDFKPAMDDLMTMLVQPRHMKLYYAGQAKNWQLAAFQINELRGALARIGRTKATDLAQFNAAYGEMTAACNDCHKGMEHAFLVIKVPDSGNFPNQEFRP
jgi:hypothetical protein